MKNIVWLASYPKSGNTWFRIFLANYNANTLSQVSLDELGSPLDANNSIDFEEIIGLNPFELTTEEVDLYRPEMYWVLSEEAERTSQILYKKTHNAYTLNAKGTPLFPEEVSKNAVYFVRNPLDVCVSYANFIACDISKMVDVVLNEETCLEGNKSGGLRQILLSWKNHIQSWQKQSLIPIHIVRYEDMLMNPVATFGSIIKFLGLEYDKERLERAIRNSDFKLLQQMEQEKGSCQKTQLGGSFFWKGKIGNYGDYLSEEQIQRIVGYNYDTMKEFGYINEVGKLTV